VTTESGSRAVVVVQTVAFSAAYVAAVILLQRYLLASRIGSRDLSLALAVALVQCVAIMTMLGISFCLKVAGNLVTSRAARVQPRIREALALHVAGANQAHQIRSLWNTYAREVEQCLVEFLSTMRGGGRDALSDLAGDLGLARKWQSQFSSRNVTKRKRAVAHLALISRQLAGETLQRALLDPDESVRLHTACAILQNCELGETVDVFRLAVNGSLVTRMILTEALQPHALELCREAIPAVLSSADAERCIAVLDMLRAWGKFFPLRQVYPLLRHADARVRVAALRILPNVERMRRFDLEILDALGDPAEEVRAAAAETAAAMHVENALAALVCCLREDHSKPAAAAAWALVQLGPEGCRVLEQEMLTGSPHSASAALEALEGSYMRSFETVAR
jgi:hypothetical protein